MPNKILAEDAEAFVGANLSQVRTGVTAGDEIVLEMSWCFQTTEDSPTPIDLVAAPTATLAGGSAIAMTPIGPAVTSSQAGSRKQRVRAYRTTAPTTGDYTLAAALNAAPSNLGFGFSYTLRSVTSVTVQAKSEEAAPSSAGSIDITTGANAYLTYTLTGEGITFTGPSGLNAVAISGWSGGYLIDQEHAVMPAAGAGLKTCAHSLSSPSPWGGLAISFEETGGGGGDTTPPTITGPATVNVAENTTAVATYSANETVTWSIAGGADAARFTINSSGALAFTAAPDFENPTDAGANNVYNVTIRATDTATPTANTTDLAIAVTVTDVVETATVGFRFSSAAGLQFGAFVGTQTSLARRPDGEAYTVFVHNDTSRTLIATSPALQITGGAGRLPNWTNSSLVAGTTYFVSFRRADGASCSARLVAENIP
jgi:hypothetical protein